MAWLLPDTTKAKCTRPQRSASTVPPRPSGMAAETLPSTLRPPALVRVDRRAERGTCPGRGQARKLFTRVLLIY